MVSNLGRVSNYKQIMESRLDKDGYERITLTNNVGGKKQRKTFFVHRLVAEVFIPNTENFSCVNHIDENKLNNCLENLEWCSRKYNNCYGTRKRLLKKPKTSKRVLLTSTGEIYNSMSEAASCFGVSSGAIYNCCVGRNKTCCGMQWRFI